MLLVRWYTHDLLVAGLFGSSLGQVQKIVLQHRDCLWAARPGQCLEGASDNLQGLLAHNTVSCPLRTMRGTRHRALFCFGSFWFVFGAFLSVLVRFCLRVGWLSGVWLLGWFLVGCVVG